MGFFVSGGKGGNIYYIEHSCCCRSVDWTFTKRIAEQEPGIRMTMLLFT